MNLDNDVRAAHLQRQIDREIDPDLHVLVLGLCRGKPGLGDSETVGARGNVGEEVAPGRVRIRSARDIGCDIGQRNRGARHHRIRLVSH